MAIVMTNKPVMIITRQCDYSNFNLDESPKRPRRRSSCVENRSPDAYLQSDALTGEGHQDRDLKLSTTSHWIHIHISTHRQATVQSTIGQEAQQQCKSSRASFLNTHLYLPKHSSEVWGGCSPSGKSFRVLRACAWCRYLVRSWGKTLHALSFFL